MSYIWTGLVAISIVCCVVSGRGSLLAGAVMEGAQSGITLAVSMAGAICLWTGIGNLMEQIGLTGMLAKLLRPILNRVFPSTKKDHHLACCLSANLCANILGLGNAATPMGMQAARQLATHGKDGVAGDELCRLIVLNTASIQLIPASVAAVRSAQGCQTPFDILPGVWITSFCSAGLGLCAAWILGKLWTHE